jgi:predicted RNA binding protein YcfA (HicA-like mRNA interferase family)
MGALKAISWRDLVRRLRDHGFEGPHGGGKHLFMIRGDKRLTIPNPHRAEIGPALLERILKQARIEKADW